MFFNVQLPTDPGDPGKPWTPWGPNGPRSPGVPKKIIKDIIVKRLSPYQNKQQNYHITF